MPLFAGWPKHVLLLYGVSENAPRTLGAAGALLRACLPKAPGTNQVRPVLVHGFGYSAGTWWLVLIRVAPRAEGNSSGPGRVRPDSYLVVVPPVLSGYTQEHDGRRNYTIPELPTLQQ
jgi:hypothetical protein